jgi:outer membrane biosynthesis protein TonB
MHSHGTLSVHLVRFTWQASNIFTHMALAKLIQQEKEQNLKAGGYTLVITAGVFVMLILISWTIPYPPPPLLNEGIEVNLGNSETGLGDIPPMIPGEPAPEAAEQIASTPPSTPPAPEPVTAEEESDDETAVTLPKKVEKTVNKPKPITNQTVEAKKVNNTPPAPPQPKPKAAMGAYTGGKGPGGNNQDAFNGVRNQGIAGGTGDQGKPNGNINSDSYTGNGGRGGSGVAISRGLSGRSITRFPSFEDDFNENAKIAVDIKVNENGQVISASYQSRGSTSSNANLKAIALRKARELKFNAGDTESSGTVVFNFKLKG